MIGDVVIIVHTHVNILGTKHTNERHRLEYIFPYLFCFTIRCDAREYYIYIYIPAIGDGVSLGKTEIDDFRARTTRQVK